VELLEEVKKKQQADEGIDYNMLFGDPVSEVKPSLNDQNPQVLDSDIESAC
jgi:hypothetical protein